MPSLSEGDVVDRASCEKVSEAMVNENLSQVRTPKDGLQAALRVY